MSNSPPTPGPFRKDGRGEKTGREMLIECTQVGALMRVTAIDAATGTEVTFQAPANAGRATIQRIAADKLAYVMKREK